MQPWWDLPQLRETGPKGFSSFSRLWTAWQKNTATSVNGFIKYLISCFLLLIYEFWSWRQGPCEYWLWEMSDSQKLISFVHVEVPVSLTALSTDDQLPGAQVTCCCHHRKQSHGQLSYWQTQAPPRYGLIWHKICIWTRAWVWERQPGEGHGNQQQGQGVLLFDVSVFGQWCAWQGNGLSSCQLMG